MPMLFLRSLGLLAAVLAGLGTTPTHYELVEGSQFWIDGSATTGRWMQADAVRGRGVVGDGALAAQVAVPVRDFDCGSRLMSRDLARALDADAHPDMRTARPRRPGRQRAPPSGSGSRSASSGRSTWQVPTAGSRSAPRAAAWTTAASRCEDACATDRPVGVRPPSHAGGLIRAHDAIVARSDPRRRRLLTPFHSPPP